MTPDHHCPDDRRAPDIAAVERLLAALLEEYGADRGFIGRLLQRLARLSSGLFGGPVEGGDADSGATERPGRAAEISRLLAEELARLTPTELDGLDGELKAGLYRALVACSEPRSAFYNVPLAVAILRVMAHIGDRQALSHVERLESRRWVTQSGRQLGAAARECAGEMRRRLAGERKGDALLRPAKQPPEALLRTLPAPAGEQAGNLLHPAAPERDDANEDDNR